MQLAVKKSFALRDEDGMIGGSGGAEPSSEAGMPLRC
jgi:hypothetical protein